MPVLHFFLLNKKCRKQTTVKNFKVQQPDSNSLVQTAKIYPIIVVYIVRPSFCILLRFLYKI